MRGWGESEPRKEKLLLALRQEGEGGDFRFGEVVSGDNDEDGNDLLSAGHGGDPPGAVLNEKGRGSLVTENLDARPNFTRRRRSRERQRL